MKFRILVLTAVLIGLTLFHAGPAAAQQQLIVRTTSLPLLKQACLLNSCTVVGNLDGKLNQLFLVDVPSILPISTVEAVLKVVPGVVDVEVNALLSIGGSVPLESIPNGLNQRSPVDYYGAPVWMGYAQQPAAGMIQLPEAQSQFQVTGQAVVADIDTGVDFSHPALKAVLLPGYDFTRNQVGGNEMADVSNPAASSCSTCENAGVDQSTAAVLDQSTAAVLDQSTAAVLDQSQYSDFGHGTMVLGVVHLVAPTAMLMPLKSFSSNGTGSLSNILAAIYYGVQNNANVINMSFDFGSYDSSELAQAIAYAEKNGVVCVASAGNEGASTAVYPAALAGVMGVGSVSDTDQRSSFSNFGAADVWVAAPGENIISTYPYDTYASESGTSFTAPMVSGTVALILQMNSASTLQQAAAAIAQAQPLPASEQLGHGLLNVYGALAYIKTLPASPK
jgi:subtilisin family serine protease